MKSLPITHTPAPEPAPEPAPDNSLLVVRYEESVSTEEPAPRNPPPPTAPPVSRKRPHSTDSDDDRLVIDEPGPASTGPAPSSAGPAPSGQGVAKKRTGAAAGGQCPFCDMTTKYSHVLRDHICSHYRVKPYTCTACGFQENRNKVRAHAAAAHRGHNPLLLVRPTTLPPQPVDQPWSPAPLACLACNEGLSQVRPPACGPATRTGTKCARRTAGTTRCSSCGPPRCRRSRWTSPGALRRWLAWPATRNRNKVRASHRGHNPLLLVRPTTLPPQPVDQPWSPAPLACLACNEGLSQENRNKVRASHRGHNPLLLVRPTTLPPQPVDQPWSPAPLACLACNEGLSQTGYQENRNKVRASHRGHNPLLLVRPTTLPPQPVDQPWSPAPLACLACNEGLSQLVPSQDRGPTQLVAPKLVAPRSWPLARAPRPLVAPQLVPPPARRPALEPCAARLPGLSQENRNKVRASHRGHNPLLLVRPTTLPPQPVDQPWSPAPLACLACNEGLSQTMGPPSSWAPSSWPPAHGPPQPVDQPWSPAPLACLACNEGLSQENRNKVRVSHRGHNPLLLVRPTTLPPQPVDQPWSPAPLACLACNEGLSQISADIHRLSHPNHMVVPKTATVIKCTTCGTRHASAAEGREHAAREHAGQPRALATYRMLADVRRCLYCNNCAATYREMALHNKTAHPDLPPAIKEELQLSFIAKLDDDEPPKKVAKKSTTKLPAQTVAKKSTTKLPFFYYDESDVEEYSYYGTKPTPIENYENVTTLMSFCNTMVPFTMKKLSEIIEINPRVIVEDLEKKPTHQ
ncbi:zinc finger protein 48-like [Ostrinia nubilalis]|uniref:zinc finger protein 48-like n=1 Tax=Ostrinia nubilalis TaxID=29057 RepID=UPI0030822183